MTEVADNPWLERVTAETAILEMQAAGDKRAIAINGAAYPRTPERLADILQGLAQGASFNAVAKAAGTSAAALTRWRKADEGFDKLCNEAIANAYAIREMNIASDKDWKAQLAWLRARKHVLADPDWQAEQTQGHSGITVNITLRQDDAPSLVDVTPKPEVLGHDKD